MSDQWLTIIEYARAFNVSDMTVRRRIRNGKLQAVLKEGKYFIPLNQDSQVDNRDVNEGPPTNRRPTAVVKNHPMSRSTLVDSNIGFQNPTTTNLGSTESGKPQQYPDQSSYSQTFVRDPLGCDESKLSGKHDVSPAYIGSGGPQREKFNASFMENCSQSETASQTAIISANNLMEFCQAMAKRLDKSEKGLRSEYDAKLRELQASAKNKDLIIRELRQKVEDLQLLVNIIDQNQ